MPDSRELALEDENVIKAIERGFIELSQGRIIYNLKQKKIHYENSEFFIYMFFPIKFYGQTLQGILDRIKIKAIP